MVIWTSCHKSLSLSDTYLQPLLTLGKTAVTKDGQPYLAISIDSYKITDDYITAQLNIYELWNPTKTVTHTFTYFSSSQTLEFQSRIIDILIQSFTKDGGYSGATVTRTFKNLDILVSDLSHMSSNT